MRISSQVGYSSNVIHGVLLLNKAKDCTSQQAVSEIKRLFRVKKAGHTGSLDPIATGVLPICLGEATKFSQFLLASDKHYLVTAKLGIRTNTGDSEGEMIAQHTAPRLTANQIENILSSFKGNILQVPPMFSALKHQGKPLYQWARQGVSIQREPRPVSIDSLQLINYQNDQFSLEVRCSKGTYIRTLIDDIGVKLGCGAHVIQLHRLSVGQYTIEQTVEAQKLHSLSNIEERINHLLPIDALLPQEWSTLLISDPAAFYLKRGQPLYLPNTPQKGYIRLLLKSSRHLLGIAQVLRDGRVAPYRLINDL